MPQSNLQTTEEVFGDVEDIRSGVRNILPRYGMEGKPTVKQPMPQKSYDYLPDLVQKYVDDDGWVNRRQYLQDAQAEAFQGFDTQSAVQSVIDSMPALFNAAFKGQATWDDRHTLNPMQADWWNRRAESIAKSAVQRIKAEQERREGIYDQKIKSFDYDIGQIEKIQRARGKLQSDAAGNREKLYEDVHARLKDTDLDTMKRSELLSVVGPLSSLYRNQDLLVLNMEEGWRELIGMLEEEPDAPLPKHIATGIKQIIAHVEGTEDPEKLPYVVDKEYEKKIGDEYVTRIYKGQDEKGKNLWKEISRAPRYKPETKIILGDYIEKGAAKDLVELLGSGGTEFAYKQAARAVDDFDMLDTEDRSKRAKDVMEAELRKHHPNLEWRDVDGVTGWYEPDGTLIRSWDSLEEISVVKEGPPPGFVDSGRLSGGKKVYINEETQQAWMQ